MTESTSKAAYEAVKASGELGKAQRYYLAAFIASERPMSHAEATRAVLDRFGQIYPPRNGRISELEQMGLLEKRDQDGVGRTGKPVNRWAWTGRLRPHKRRVRWTTCDRCGGSGRVLKGVYEHEPAQQTELFGGAA